MVTLQGIKSDPIKMSAIIEMTSTSGVARPYLMVGHTMCQEALLPTVRLIKKFTFRTVVNIHICVVHLTYLTLLLPRTYVLAGVRVVRVYRLKFLRSLAN